MERFDSLWDFMMLAVIYFFWPLASMLDVDWAARILASMVGVAVALWIYGVWGAP